MILYRGCKESGIKVMEPRLVNHDKPYVYATNDLVEAVIYSVKGGNFNYTNIYGYDDNNKRCLIERKKDCLETIFNVPGRYYLLDDKNFKKHNEIGVGDNEYVSEKPVKVIEEINIPNVWEFLNEKQEQGIIKIYRYPNRPSSYPDDDSDLIECAMLTYIDNGNLDMAFGLLEKHHPELLDRINKTKDIIKSQSKEEILKSIKHFK